MLALLGQLDIYCWPKGPTKDLQGIICWPYWDHEHGRSHDTPSRHAYNDNTSGRTLAFAVSLPPGPRSLTHPRTDPRRVGQASGEMRYKHKLPQSQGRAHEMRF